MATHKKSENIYEIEKEGAMKVTGVVFASDNLFEKIKQDKTVLQVKNVACLPGIVKQAMAMPDAHQGYGFPVGGVAAFDLKKGIISPGGIGYDINCGVRLLVANLSKKEFLKKREQVLADLYKNVPSGVGKGTGVKLSDAELNSVLEKGAGWCLEKGYATKDDVKHIEDGGCIAGADAGKVSPRAKARGRDQLGTLGAGNHFLEIQFAEEIFDEKTAKVFGITRNDQVCVMIHTGSRGLGHQTASDYIMKMEKKYGWENLPDRELACAPIESDLGKEYRAAMAAAANFAFANRQLISYYVRKSFAKFFPDVKLELMYDVAHNIAKFEELEIGGKKETLCVHRKGATRSFGPGRKEVPSDYRKIGQPIIIPGSMGTNSYVLVGTSKAEEVSFASTAHGAGRVMSRSGAKGSISVEAVKKELADRDIVIKAGSDKGIVEEAPAAYKDVNEVVRVSHELGIGNLVVKLRPLAVVKG